MAHKPMNQTTEGVLPAMNNQCENCRHWDVDGCAPTDVDQDGFCHALPPTPSLTGRGVWPITSFDDACGFWAGGYR